MEILGMITLKISDGEYGRINIGIKHNEEQRGVQFQVNLSSPLSLSLSLSLSLCFIISFILSFILISEYSMHYTVY